MKVFLVTHYDETDVEYLGIFSSYEKAEECKKNQDNLDREANIPTLEEYITNQGRGGYAKCYIEEFELDKSDLTLYE